MDEEQTKNNNTNSAKRQIGITLLVLTLVLFVLTTFEFLYVVKAFLLGVFGVMLYPVLLCLVFVSIALIMNKEFIYSPKYVLYILLSFFFFVCCLHIAFNWKAGEELAYGEFLKMCYDKMYTPGGLFIGVFTYALTGLLNSMAGLVIYAIGLVISIYLIVSYLDSFKQKLKNKEVRPAYQTFDFKEPKIENLIETPQKVQTPVTVEETEDDDDEAEEDDSNSENIFIKDEETSQTELAKEKLGLAPIKKEEEEESASDKLFKKDIDPWQNRAFQNDKPQKFLYGQNNESKKNDPLIQRNKEYLSTIHDLNNVNDNPIINAEDLDDYREKMKLYKEKHRKVLKRDDIVAPSEEDDEDSDNIEFGIEPEHDFNNSKIVNFDDDDDDNDDAGQFYDDEYSYDDDDSYDEDDYIKEDDDEEDFDDDEPITAVNFNGNIGSKNVRKHNEDNRSQKFIEESSLTENSIEESLNKKISVNTNRNFNFDILGGNPSVEHKPVEPDFKYDDNYVRPPIDLLKAYENEEENVDNEQNIKALEEVLEEFKIPAKVEAVRRGAAVTRYELHMPVGISVRKINAHSSDIALALAAKSDIRIEAPIKGKSAVGIEVPNNKIDVVGLREIIDSSEFMNAKAPLTFALGKDIDGGIYCCNLAKTPHLLVAGSTGSGKSVCLNSLILSLMYKTSPEDLRMILVDPKLVEFAIYNDLPHMLMPKAITDPKKALKAFDWLIDEMERRYLVFQHCYVKNIKEYNSQPDVVSKKKPKLPYIVLIVDELADLVITAGKKEVEEKIIRLTQKARAAGIHLILATQRPSVDIITGSIKINLPTRIAFAVTNFMDSRTIIDQGGAEKLLGRGDMLYSPLDGEPTRVQGAFVDTPEVKAVVDFIKENNPCHYDDNISKTINSEPRAGEDCGGGFVPSADPLLMEALKLVVENGQASISMLQRRFAIGYQRAAKIIDQMEMGGFISGSDGSKPRTVYMSEEDFNKKYGGNI